MDNILNGFKHICFKYLPIALLLPIWYIGALSTNYFKNDSMKVLFLVITSFWCLALYYFLKVDKFAID